jgi:hypothetical protein
LMSPSLTPMTFPIHDRLDSSRLLSSSAFYLFFRAFWFVDRSVVSTIFLGLVSTLHSIWPPN